MKPDPKAWAEKRILVLLGLGLLALALWGMR